MIEILLVAVWLYVGVVIYKEIQIKYWYFTYIYKNSNGIGLGKGIINEELSLYKLTKHLEKKGFDNPIITNFKRVSKYDYDEFNKDINKEDIDY